MRSRTRWMMTLLLCGWGAACQESDGAGPAMTTNKDSVFGQQPVGQQPNTPNTPNNAGGGGGDLPNNMPGNQPAAIPMGDGDVAGPPNVGPTPQQGDGDDSTSSGDGDDSPPVQTTSDDVWAQMGFDERNWFFNPSETTLGVDNAAQLELKWTFEVAGFPPGTPLIVDGKVFVMATGGTYAIDLETGQELWSRSEVAGTASLAYADGALYAHANGANLYRLNPETGETVWGPANTYSMNGCDGTSSPVVAGGLVIVGHSCGALEVGAGAGNGMAKGGVEAHNIADGAKAWTYGTTEGSEDGAMVWSSVGIDMGAGVVYASTGNNYTVLGDNSDAMHAIDLMTGDRIWRTQVNTGDLWSLFVAAGGPDTDFGANPIVLDGMVAAGDKGSSFWALDDATGDVAWSRTRLSPSRDPAHGGILMAGAFDGTTFYSLVNHGGAGRTNLVALSKDGGADAWPAKTYSGNAWAGPSVANGVLYAPVDDRLYVLDASNGTELKSFTTGGTIAAGAPAVAQGHVVVGSGLLYGLDRTAKNNNEVICYGLP